MLKRLAVLTAISAFIFSCSTTYSIRVLKPSEINLAPIKNIAVMDFHFDGDWDYEKEHEPTTLKGVAIEILKRQLGLKQTQERPYYHGEEVSSRIVTDLVNNGHYTVLERSRLARIKREHNLPLRGMIKKNQIARVGKLTGAEALIMGSGSFMIRDVGMWEDHVVKDENDQEFVIQKYRAMRKVDVTINYRIVNVATGEVIVSRNMSNRNYTSGTANCSDFALDDIKENAIQNIPAWKPIIDRLVGNISYQIVKQISPHWVVRRKKIENGRSPRMKAALKYAKRGMWEEAKELWDKVLEAKSGKEIKDIVSALYNLGVYYEIHDNLDMAEALYDKSFRKSGDDRYLNAKSAVQYRRNELQRLEEQMSE